MEPKPLLLTPQIAADWLNNQTIGTATDPARVNEYATLMSNRQWRPNTLISRFSCGQLIDGAHRLHAVVKSGVAITILLFTSGQPYTE